MGSATSPNLPRRIPFQMYRYSDVSTSTTTKHPSYRCRFRFHISHPVEWLRRRIVVPQSGSTSLPMASGNRSAILEIGIHDTPQFSILMCREPRFPTQSFGIQRHSATHSTGMSSTSQSSQRIHTLYPDQYRQCRALHVCSTVFADVAVQPVFCSHACLSGNSKTAAMLSFVACVLLESMTDNDRVGHNLLSVPQHTLQEYPSLPSKRRYQKWRVDF